MQSYSVLWFLVGSLLGLTHCDVVSDFSDDPECIKYFYNGKVPQLGTDIAAPARICQRYQNQFFFATMYDTFHRIAVYSAYFFEPSNGGGREDDWFIEPQLVNQNWGNNMIEGYLLQQQNPGVYLGDRQALNEDYTNSGFDRGHLNPNGHHPVPSRNATFTLTNVIPQNPTLNQNSWANYESSLTSMFNSQCDKAYVLVGGIPSADNWIIKNNVKRVNIPDYIWNAYCCVGSDGSPISSGGATALNTAQNVVVKRTMSEMVDFLQQYSNIPVGELFMNHCQ